MWIYNTSTARQYRSGGFETPPSVALLPEERIRKGVRRCSHHSPLASSFVRGMRTVPREWCRLREGVGPFNFSNRRRATRRGTGEMIVGNMRETFSLFLFFLSFFFLTQQASASNSASLAVKANLLFPLCLPSLPPSPISCLPAVYSLRKCFAA